MACTPEVAAAIAALRGDGSTVAIVGFGAGFSNVSRLRTLPIDRINLDRTLIAPIVDRDARARSFRR